MLGDYPDLVAEREAKLRALGPYPPWWRPFARRSWRRRNEAAVRMDVSYFAWVLRQHYSPECVEHMGARRSFAELMRKR